MKKLLFVVENLKLGGIQKSLCNLLCSENDKYDITLLLLDNEGEYANLIPTNVKRVFLPEYFKVYAEPLSVLKKQPRLYTYKSIFCILTKLINKGVAFKICSPFYRVEQEYDVAISFSHSGYYKGVNGICPEFVLQKVNAKKKICFIHCDYQNSGFRCKYNDSLYYMFDKIACCSDSVRTNLVNANPQLSRKTVTVRNFYDLNYTHVIRGKINIVPEKINLFSIARLSKEKGIARAVRALAKSEREDICYYIIGDGPEKEEILNIIADKGLKSRIFLLGAKKEPLPFLKNADYLLVPSYNEAAPMVFDEAKALDVPVISTNTTSAEEMLTNINDMICENSEEGLIDVLKKIQKPTRIPSHHATLNNDLQQAQFDELLNFN